MKTSAQKSEAQKISKPNVCQYNNFMLWRILFHYYFIHVSLIRRRVCRSRSTMFSFASIVVAAKDSISHTRNNSPLAIQKKNIWINRSDPLAIWIDMYAWWF